MCLKTVHISNRTKFFWKRVAERWRCYHKIKAPSPNVFDRTAGIESKILPEDLRLYLHKRRSILFYLHDTKVVYKMRLTWSVAC